MTAALSSKWASRQHALLGRTTDDATRLAIGIGIIKSAVRVVDRTLPPLTVDWASVNPDESAPVRSMSYTDFRGHAIKINPMPMLDRGIGHGQALDTCIGFGLHEASHSQESRDRFEFLLKKEDIVPASAEEVGAYKAVLGNEGTLFNKVTGRPMREVPAFEPMRIAAYLWNLVEDVRIETVTGNNWPGFRPYFGCVVNYLWNNVAKSKEGLPVKYGPALKDKLRVAFLACRVPDRWNVGKSPLAAEKTWWHNWQADYLAGTTDTPTTIQRGLDHLAEDKKTKQEMEQEAAKERKEREAGERLRAQLERLINEGVKGAYDICIDESGEVRPLDRQLAEEVRKLVREGLAEHRPILAEGNADLRVMTRKPEETPESRRSYIGRPNAEAEALRAALVFRQSAPEYDEKLLKSGSMDDDELYRWAAGDYRVFSERVIESKPEVYMGLLVDLSGSMYGEKLKIAQRLAQLFVWAVYDQPGIETAVWGHTTGELDEVDVFRVWEPGDPIQRLGLIASLPHSGNGDGHAIAQVVTEITERASQPQKVLVVLSDGLPNAMGYGSGPAHLHVRQVVQWAASRGVTVLQLAIDPNHIRPQDQAAMYGEGNWTPFVSYAALPRQITSLLSRFI